MKAFGIRDKMGYFWGDFGGCFFYILNSGFLMTFYTDIMGVSGYLVGIVLFAARMYSACSDVFMGRLIDRVPPSGEGKFRVWVRRMSLPYVIATLLLFLPLGNLPMGVKVAYMMVTYLFFVSMGSAYGIPYGAMAAAMTREPGERAALSTFRNVGSSVSSAIANFTIPIVCITTVAVDGGTVEKLNSRNFFLVVVIICILAYISFRACYRMCTERVEPKQAKASDKKSATLLDSLKGLVHNRPFWALSGAAIILLLSQQIVGSINAYVYKDYFGESGLLSVAGLLMTFCTFAVAPFMSGIIRRFGKKEAVCAAAFTSGFFYLLLFALHTENVWCYLAISLLATFGAAFFNTIVWALVMDVINYQELITGTREEASIYSLYSFFRKVGQALAGGLGAAALSVVGYVSASGNQVIRQSQETVNNIYNMATLIPGIAYTFIALVMLLAYPLSRTKVLEMTKTLSRE
ncbi:MAG: glycoside-pentoside-hexuronide (GPH):cation symporter [Eubacteriales bacterium]|nr:glycoside-pentoside-hexuronide (GPH):cation symporter [Eubacteriales bacterium]